jgi:dihydrolipoamide dehydrogenase
MLVKWNKKEGERIRAGEEIADVETDKATMPLESFNSGTLAVILVKAGQKVKVGETLAVVATGTENPEDVKKKYASGAAGGGAKPQAAAAPAPTPKTTSTSAPASNPKSEIRNPKSSPAKSFQFDVIVIGGGPAGYAAAIRAGQLKKRVLCVEKENLGGTCLNWGCIPTKALLEDGAFIRRMKSGEAEAHGVTIGDLKIDFGKIIGRSRNIADKLQKGIGHLFKKYNVAHEMGTGQVLGPHKVQINGKSGAKEVSGEHIIIAVGAKSTELPFAKFDGKTIVTSREAMTLPRQPKRMAIIGAGAIGCEFADFYNSIGTEVTIIEMLPHLLPIEDTDVSVTLEKVFTKRGIKVHTKTKTDKIEKTDKGVNLTLSGDQPGTVEADVVLVAVGVTGNSGDLAGKDSGLKVERGRVVVDDHYATGVEGVWAVGDCIAMNGSRHPDLAHVAHHEAVHVVERIAGRETHGIDYANIPACTYTHPQVASMGATERKLREEGREIRVGKFPFSVSGRALAAGETDGFVKLIFDAKYGELLGVHMIGENVTELLSELVMAKKLEATEAEIIDAIHPHPTMSEAVMEAAGVSVNRAIHL